MNDSRRYKPIILTLFLAAIISLVAEERVNDPTSFTWNPERAPSGAVVVSVNLKSQTATVFRGGTEIGRCIVSTGKQGHETPTGVFHILEKDADHHSSTYNNAPMPYSERLTWGGVALHAGSLPGYPSSHGCIHLPYEFSKKLFEVTSLGGTVIISDGSSQEAPTKGHRIEFAAHEESDVHWTPHEAGPGPVSIFFSSSDKQVQVVRAGVLIARGKAHYQAFAEKPSGTYTFAFDGWQRDPETATAFPHWHQVSGPADSHQLKEFGRIQTDPRLKHILDTVVTPGTTLTVTNQPMSKLARSEPGFRIMQGSRSNPRPSAR